MMYDLVNKNFAGECIAMFKRWLENRNVGKTFADYLTEYGFKTIAIFDAGEIGQLLYAEVKNSEIEVKYFIDRNAEGIRTIDGIPVIQPNIIEKMEVVDLVLVSPVFDYVQVSKLFVDINPRIGTISMKDAVYEF